MAGHYFPHDPGISLLEILLDLCISYLIRPPINAAATKLRIPGVPVLLPMFPAKPRRSFPNCVCDFTSGYADGLRPRLYWDLWLRVSTDPYDPASTWEPSVTRQPGFLQCCTVSESHTCLVFRLQGQTSFISDFLVPDVRVLRYTYSIPRRSPLPLPPEFPSDFWFLMDPEFNQECLSTSHTARWGRTLCNGATVTFGFLQGL